MSGNAEKRTDDAQRKMKVRTAEAEIRKYVPVQLTFWAEERRAIANEMARCSLFHARDGRKPRLYFDNAPLFMLGEGHVYYKGEELRTQDEDVFISLVHLARELPANKLLVKVTSSEICKMNKWRQDQRYYNSIYLSIQRMKAGAVTFFSRRLAKALRCEKALEAGASQEEMLRLYDELAAYESSVHSETPLDQDGDEVAGIMLSLISGEPIMTGAKSVKDGIPQGNLTWEIVLDKRIVSLFAKSYLTFVDLETRQGLSGTGKRLQAYFLSHKKPHPVKLRSLEKMLGLDFADLAALKFFLTEQLEALKPEVISKFEFKKSADGTDWLVIVTRADQPELT
jgi:hypothetical protein